MNHIWNAIKSIFVNDAYNIISERGKEILAEQHQREMKRGMKQTAVKWLIDEIKFARHLCDDPSAEMDIWHTLDVLISKGEEAKEMEKEQIKDAYKQGTCHHGDGYTATEYYEETFVNTEK